MPEIPTGNALLNAPGLLEWAGLDYGMTVADLGCGTLGHFTFPAAHMVGPEGKVYAVDILPSALTAIKSRIGIEQVNNVETVWGDMEVAGGIRIPEASVHFAVMANVTSLLTKSATAIKEIKRILKPGARILAVDWRPEAKGFGPDPAKRHQAVEIAGIFTDFGFTVKKEFDAGPSHWGLIVEKS